MNDHCDSAAPEMISIPQLWTRGFAPLALLACTVGGALLAGCRATPLEKADATVTTLRATASGVAAESHALEGTMRALTSLQNSPAPDLKQQFRAFDGALDRLADSVQQTERATRRLQARSADYFDAWDAQLAAMNYGIVRELSATRRAAVCNQMELLLRRDRDTREVVLPLLEYLEDIRRALAADLTAEGIASVKNVIANAEANAGRVQLGLAGFHQELRNAGARISSAATRQPPAAGPSPSPIIESRAR